MKINQIISETYEVSWQSIHNIRLAIGAKVISSNTLQNFACMFLIRKILKFYFLWSRL